jgi:hypothetical protein
MTRRLPVSKLRRILPPNPANVARKLRRIRQEIQGILDSIDDALVHVEYDGNQESEKSS